jgi:hypothetical protein
MKLRPALVVSILALLCAGGGVAWMVFVRGVPATSSAPSGGSFPLAKPDANGLALEKDHAAVFQRAFWRRPAAEDKILQAERRDWLDGSSGVQKWQWYIAVQPGAAFRDWLLKDNPFELVVVAPGTELAPLSSPPAWFPAAGELAGLSRYRNREGRYVVFHDPANNRLYATDAGGGFAGAKQ